MSTPRMFVPRSMALSMLNSFRSSVKFSHYQHLQRAGRVYEEISIAALIGISEKLKSEFPQFSDIKFYFISSPNAAGGLAEVHLLICPVENGVDRQDAYILLNVYDSFLSIGDVDAFNKAKCSQSFAKQCSVKYRDEFARKFMRTTGQGIPFEDTRSVSYQRAIWEEFIEFLKNVKLNKLKAYLADTPENGVTILFTLQKLGEDIMVERFEDIPVEILRNPVSEPKNGTQGPFVFDTGNPCPPGSGQVPNECRGNGLEP